MYISQYVVYFRQSLILLLEIKSVVNFAQGARPSRVEIWL